MVAPIALPPVGALSNISMRAPARCVVLVDQTGAPVAAIGQVVPLGVHASAASLPVVLASDDARIAAILADLGYIDADLQAGLTGATSYASVPASDAAVADTVVKATPGRLCSVVITDVSTNGVPNTDLVFYDGPSATGVLVAAIPATATLGSYWQFNVPCTATSIVVVTGCAAGNGTAGCTVNYR